MDLNYMELSRQPHLESYCFGAAGRFVKRLLDLLVSLLMLSVLLILSPFLLAAIIAIKLEDGGPIFYSQERMTRHGRVFRIYKLRTMRVDAEADIAVWAIQDDARVTWVGTFLRRHHIDEVPQLINIVRGDMSFVGPRPERPALVAQLAQEIPFYHERHVVKAGLTGWAQVNYPYGASVNDARFKLKYDLYYAQNPSALFDFLILMRTMLELVWPGTVGKTMSLHQIDAVDGSCSASVCQARGC